MEHIIMTAHSLKKMCRLCLTQGVSKDIFVFSSKLGKEIADIIMSCAPVQITKHDKMPTCICQLCYDKLEVVNDFQKQILQCEKTLQHLLQRFRSAEKQVKCESFSQSSSDQHLSLDEDITVKCEPLEINDVFDTNISQKHLKILATPNILSDIEKDVSSTREKHYNVRIKEESTIPLNIFESPGEGHIFKINSEAAKLSSECPPLIKIGNCDNTKVFNEKPSINSNILNDVNEELFVKSKEISNVQIKEEPDFQLNVTDMNSKSPDGIVEVASEYIKMEINDTSFTPECFVYSQNKNGNEEPLKTNNFTNTSVTLEEMTSEINQPNVSIVCSQIKSPQQDSTNVCFQNEFETSQTVDVTRKCVLNSNINEIQSAILCQVRLENENPSENNIFFNTSDMFAADNLNKKIKILLPKSVTKVQQRNLMKSNRREKSIEMHECKICKKNFKTVSTLKQHKKLHSEKFQCNMCNKVFTRVDTLVLHEQLHSGEKPYRCDICSKSFACSVYLTRHKNLHVNTRSFCCEICNKTFSCSEYLRKHKKIHYKSDSN